jgi:hypothetical protein
MAFKRDDWNAVIDSVNEVITNPPSGCDPLDPIEHVEPNTVWRKSHIQEVQDALKATCDQIEFSPIPDLWKSSILAEIEGKLSQAWCNCDCKSEDGTTVVLYDNGPPKVVSPCLGTDTPDILLRSLINNLQAGRSGIVGRIWRVFRRNHRNDGAVTQVQLATGVLSCQGIVSYVGNATVSTAAGIGVNCFDCHDSACADSLANAAAHLGDPNIFYNTYALVLDCSGAVCFDCGHDGGGLEE